jgi:hypothetical protein
LPQSWLRGLGANSLLPAVAGYATFELKSAPLCRWFGPSPCPTHYRGRLATMPSADFCSITPRVAAVCAVCRLRVRWVFQGFRPGPQSGSRRATPLVEQISPDKSMNCRDTTAGFTVPREFVVFAVMCQLDPAAQPCIRFLFVGSSFCARASFRPYFAVSPLPSASRYDR